MPEGLLPDVPGFSQAKRRIFVAAIALFGERGYHVVSVRDIAGMLGLKPMALYAHAPSKQDLLFGTVSFGFDTHRAELDAALLVGADPIDQIAPCSCRPWAAWGCAPPNGGRPRPASALRRSSARFRPSP